MAKKVNNEDDEVRDYSETSTEETAKEQATEAVISQSKKLVKIRATENIDCLIACKPYKLSKDKEMSVSSDVAAILCFANKAYRL